MEIETILGKEDFTREDIVTLLGIDDDENLKKLYSKANETKAKYVGNRVYFRGIIEFSNYCIKDCYYCGIRKSNSEVNRFMMNEEEIIKSAMWAYDKNYGSIVLQSGERTDEEYVSFVERILSRIKLESNNKLGITLSLGEQTEDTYRRWYEAGAHRYLLRIETSKEELYKRLHPEDHSHKARIECIKMLKRLGYQVGTGVMIGLPNQTLEDLAEDIIFYKDNDVDMIGMGPYVVHSSTPLGVVAENSPEIKNIRYNLGLKMIAVTRLFLKDVNIAATTALQALHPLGREMGLKAGANIIMPIITNLDHRKDYQLYDNKPCIDDDAEKCKSCLEGRIRSTGDTIGYGEWGDSKHFKGL